MIGITKDAIMGMIQSPKSLESQKLNAALWTKLIEKLSGVDIDRSFLSFPIGANFIGCWPLSFGPLKATGLLREVYKLPQAHELNMNIGRGRPLWYQKDNANFEERLPYYVSSTTTAVEHPTLYIFKALDGDSTLFSWRDINILLDGGKNYTLPCYWDKVKTLSCLDMVILTHGDCDHINGLLPLFYRKKYDKKNGKQGLHINEVCFVTFDEEEPERDWSHVAELHTVAKEADIDIVPPAPGKIIFKRKFTNNDEVSLTVVWPDDSNLDKAKEMLERYRLTQINKSSLALVLHCHQ